MTKEQQLVEIIWNTEKNSFVRKDTDKPVKEVIPLGPLLTLHVTSIAGCDGPKQQIFDEAKKYAHHIIGYEATKTAHDINPQEYDPHMHDIWAVRLYKIS